MLQASRLLLVPITVEIYSNQISNIAGSVLNIKSLCILPRVTGTNYAWVSGQWKLIIFGS